MGEGKQGAFPGPLAKLGRSRKGDNMGKGSRELFQAP